MSDINIKGNVDLDIGGMVGATEAARKAFKVLGKAGTDAGATLTKSQQDATKIIIAEYKKLATASENATTKAISEAAKQREARLNGMVSRTTKNNESSAKVDSINSGAGDKTAVSNSVVAVNEAKRETEELRAQEVIVRSTGIQRLNDKKEGLAAERIATQEVKTQAAIESAARMEAREVARLKKEAAREGIRAAKEQAREEEKAQRQASKAHEDQYANLASMRYALYDVRAGLLASSAVLAGMAVAPLVVAASWEREFANVSRTTEVFADDTTVRFDTLRSEFVKLAQTIPEDWSTLTEIGTLAGQLGIPTEQVVSFTRVVAQFGATSDVSAEQAATAFGRLNALLPDVQGDFTGLADSILKVGVNSIATEGQIVRIATQISAIAVGTSFTSEQVIGLAGALASVGVPPELSRGVVTRVFGQIARASTNGGLALERFGRLSGMTGAEFKEAWNENAGKTFLKFMSGIQSSGTGAEAAIRELGITSVRDVPILIRLANAANSAGEAGGLMAQTFGDAADAAGTLGDQYGVIADTISAKMQLLSNNIQAFLDAAGSGGLGVVGAALDTAIGSLQRLSNFAAGDFGWMLGVGMIIAGVAAALAAIGAVAITGIAGLAALTLAMKGLAGSADMGALSVGRMLTMLAATGPAGAKAAFGIRALATAMKALTAATLVLALPDILFFGQNLVDQMHGVDKSLDGITDRFLGAGSAAKALAAGAIGPLGFMREDTERRRREEVKGRSVGFELKKSNEEGRGWETTLGRSFANVGVFTGLSSAAKDFDDEMARIASGGNTKAVNEAIKELGYDNKQLGEILPETKKALDLSANAAGNMGGKYGAAALEAEELLKVEEETAAKRAALEADYVAGSSGFINLKTAMDENQAATKAWAEGQAESTDSADDSWQNFYDGTKINLPEYLETLRQQVAAQDAWQDNMLTLSERGSAGMAYLSESTLRELGRMGPEGAALVASLVTGTDEELQTFEANFSRAGADAGTAFAVAMIGVQELLANASANLGEGARTELLAALTAGAPMEEAIALYNQKLEDKKNQPKVKLDADPARAEFASFASDVKAKVLTTTLQVTPVVTKTPSAILNEYNAGRGGFTGGQFDRGGYTGDGGKYKPAGIVHKGEFVMTKEATSALGTGYLYNLMRAASRGYATGGSVGTSSNSYVPSYGGGSASRNQKGNGISVVELSVYDRALLAKAGNVSLNIDGRAVTSTTNNGNLVAARRGSN